MDKLKLQTKIKSEINEDEIQSQGYGVVYRKLHELTNNFIRVYYNEENNVSLIWDNFALRLEFNPTIYTFGHNVKMCALEDCINAVTNLGNALGVNLFSWDMVGYDFNVTIELNHQVKAYLPLLQELPLYRRSTEEKNQGKHYENKCKNRTFTAYNKIEEATKKKIIIPPNYAGRNWGRFEHSVLTKINQYKCFETVDTVGDFLTPQHWNNAANLFLKTYNSMKKHSLSNKTTSHITPPTFTTNQKGKLMDILQVGDIEKYVIELEVLLGKEAITERRFKARVKDARSIWNEYISFNTNPSESLLNELNNKIANEVQYLKINEGDNVQVLEPQRADSERL